MKNRRVFAALATMFILPLLVSCGGDNYQSYNNFDWEPGRPSPGETIEVTYIPVPPMPENPEYILMEAYLLYPGMPVLKTVELTKGDRGWTGALTFPDSVNGAFVRFVSGDNIDNNHDRGYTLLLYGDSGPVPGAYATLAEAVGLWGEMLAGTELDPQRAEELFLMEFEKHPDLKIPYFTSYLDVLDAAGGIRRTNEIKRELRIAHEKPIDDLSVEELKALVAWSGLAFLVNDAQIYADLLAEKDPYGTASQRDFLALIGQAPDMDEGVKLMEAFIDSFSVTNNYLILQEHLLRQRAERGQYEELLEVANKLPVPPSSFWLNQAAWDLATSNKQLDLALRLADKGVELAKKNLETPDYKRPPYITEKSLKKTYSEALARVLDTKAYIYYIQGGYEKSLPLFAEAGELVNWENASINEHYAECLIQAGEAEKAMERIRDFLISGNSTIDMERLFKEAYAQVNGSTEGVDAALQPVLDEAYAEVIEALQRDIYSQQAPYFELVDASEDSLSLTDYRGKPLVLVFWATWSEPSVDALPGLSDAEKYLSEQQDVEFLFMNSWESEREEFEAVREFMDDRGYNFRVGMDVDNDVIKKYEVQAIPTIFVIDANGFIRFQWQGHEEDTSKMLRTLRGMITLVKEAESGPPA